MQSGISCSPAGSEKSSDRATQAIDQYRIQYSEAGEEPSIGGSHESAG